MTKPRMLGVGSGNNQGTGKAHHSYKGGLYSIETQKCRKSKCERCDSLTKLCTHHTDRNRENNNPDNLMTLCKRCHQLEHKCTDNLPKHYSSEHRKKLSENMKRLNKTLPRCRGVNASPQKEK